MLAAFLLWLGIVPALLITAALVFPVFWGNREKRANYEERVKTTPYRNKNQYVTNVMIDFGFAKEVRFYGLQEFLLEQDISGRCGYLDNPLKKCRQQVTATLNPIAEMELYQQINGLAGEKSCVFIMHRLSGVRFSSRILYFENGRIAEQGSRRIR